MPPKLLKSSYLDEEHLEVGIDEAGRGPLFGSVYIGAAILPPDNSFNHSLMRDSKKLSERKRLIAYDYIRENAIDYCIHSINEKDIDKDNIFQATLNGMHKALDKLLVRPEFILVDGNAFNMYKWDNKEISTVCICGGDDKYSSIAAASILAKVGRDKYINDRGCLN